MFKIQDVLKLWKSCLKTLAAIEDESFSSFLSHLLNVSIANNNYSHRKHIYSLVILLVKVRFVNAELVVTVNL